MVFFFKSISILSGFLFPAALIHAIHADEPRGRSRYTALACVSFGVIVLTVMCLLPNT